MKKPVKLLCMFVPLGLLFFAVGLVGYDLKNPLSKEQDQCKVLATGNDVKPYKRADNILFDHGASSFYDIGFQCDKKGVVVINDREIFKQQMTTPGAVAWIRKKEYRYWPETWRIEVKTSF